MADNNALDMLSQLMSLKQAQDMQKYRQFQMGMAQNNYNDLLEQKKRAESLRNFRTENDPLAFEVLTQPGGRKEVLGVMNDFLSATGGTPDARDFYQKLIEDNTESPSSKNYSRGVPQYTGRTPDGGSGVIWNPQLNDNHGGFELVPIPTNGQIRPKVDQNLPSEQATFLEQGQTVQDLIGRLETMMGGDSWKDWVGPLDKRVGRLQDLTGFGANPERAVFHSTLQDIQNMMIYLRSGKQINESEYERITRAMPDPGDSEKVFKQKFTNFKTTFDSVMKNRRDVLGSQPGFRNSVGGNGGGVDQQIVDGFNRRSAPPMPTPPPLPGSQPPAAAGKPIVIDLRTKK